MSLVKMLDAAQPSSLALLPEGEGNAQRENGLSSIFTRLNMGGLRNSRCACLRTLARLPWEQLEFFQKASDTRTLFFSRTQIRSPYPCT